MSTAPSSSSSSLATATEAAVVPAVAEDFTETLVDISSTFDDRLTHNQPQSSSSNDDRNSIHTRQDSLATTTTSLQGQEEYENTTNNVNVENKEDDKNVPSFYRLPNGQVVTCKNTLQSHHHHHTHTGNHHASNRRQNVTADAAATFNSNHSGSSNSTRRPFDNLDAAADVKDMARLYRWSSGQGIATKNTLQLHNNNHPNNNSSTPTVVVVAGTSRIIQENAAPIWVTAHHAPASTLNLSWLPHLDGIETTGVDNSAALVHDDSATDTTTTPSGDDDADRDDHRARQCIKSPRQWQKRRQLGFFCCIIVAAAATIALVVAVVTTVFVLYTAPSNQDSSSNVANNASFPSAVAANAPTPAVKVALSPMDSSLCQTLSPPQSTSTTLQRATSITNYINSIKLSNGTLTVPMSFTSPSKVTSAEQAALSWLVFEDPLQLSPDNETHQFRLRQRYALLTLSPFEVFETFLSMDECQWRVAGDCIESAVPTTMGTKVVTSIFADYFTSTLSPDLSLLSNITTFAVNSLAVTMSLPPSLGTAWTNLRRFEASSSHFTGSLPPSLGATWTNLETFDVSSSDFTGSLPSLLGTTWTNLAAFDVSSNALTGSLPSTLGVTWTNLESFLVDDNTLTGRLSSSLGTTWTNLNKFYVHYNAFTGTIPSLDKNCSASFANNSFVGSVPAGFCANSNTKYLAADCDEVACSCCDACCSDVTGRCNHLTG